MRSRTHILILLALSLCIYVGTASWPALIDDADGGHAVAAREILECGDWAVLHINGIRWIEKAPLLYWLVAISYRLLGESEFATRLPLALGVTGLVLMVYVFGRSFFSERAGFYAGLVMCTGIGTYIFTRTMIPEAIYALEFTAAFYLFLRAWQGTLSPRMGYWCCSILVALAVLTRGLIGVIFPAAAIGLFLIFTGGWRRWRELPLISSAVIFLGLAVPWHVIVGLRTPGFFWFYFINEHFLRAIGARYPADYGTVPLGLWWAAHLAWFFPWSFFLPLALREFPFPPRRAEGRLTSWPGKLDAAAQARLLLFVWAGFILCFFSLTRRMEYYSFGAWPAIAILLGLGLARAEEGGHTWLPRLQGALAVAGLLFAGVLGALLWVSRTVPAAGDISNLLELKSEDFYRVAMASFFDLTPRAFAALRTPAGVAALSFLIGLSVAWFFRRRGRNLASDLAMALGMAGFLFAANLAFQVLEPHMSSRPLARAILQHLRPADKIVIYGEFYGGPTIGFYTKQKLLIFNGRYHGLEFGSYFPDAPNIFLTDRDFPALWHGPERVFLFAPQHHRRDVLVRLPPSATWVLAESGGKAVYTNRPLMPNQPALAQLGADPTGKLLTR